MTLAWSFRPGATKLTGIDEGYGPVGAQILPIEPVRGQRDGNPGQGEMQVAGNLGSFARDQPIPPQLFRLPPLPCRLESQPMAGVPIGRIELPAIRRKDLMAEID